MADVVYGDISVSATTSATANTIWPNSSEAKKTGSLIEITNNGAVDCYINCAGIHAPNSWYAMAAGSVKVFDFSQIPGQKPVVLGYVASTACNIRAIPLAV